MIGLFLLSTKFFSFVINRLILSSKIQEHEHTDSMSYSWVLMRYAIVRLVYKRLWAFFPHIGIANQGESTNQLTMCHEHRSI
jgi:hypothetical protein